MFTSKMITVMLVLGSCLVTYCEEMNVVNMFSEINRFHDASEVTLVERTAGVVMIQKIKDGDAFVKWGKPNGGMLILNGNSDVVEVDFSGFINHGKADVYLMFLDNQGKWLGSVCWLKKVSKPERFVLSSVKDFAATNGKANAKHFLLFFRVASGKDTGFELADICVGKDISEKGKKEFYMNQLNSIDVSIDTGNPLAVAEPFHKGILDLVITNTSNTDVNCSALWWLQRYSSETNAICVNNLPSKIDLEAKQSIRIQLPKEMLQPDFWNLKFEFKHMDVTRNGYTSLAVMPILKREKPLMGGFHYAVASGPLETVKANEVAWGIAAMGATMARSDFHWNVIQPKKDVWEWEKYDRFVNELSKYGIEPQVLLAYCAKWAAPENVRNSANRLDWFFAPPELSAWSNYVSKVASRYAESVRFYEVWNEPDLWNFWHGNTEQYIDLLRVTYPAVHNADKNAMVMTGGFATLTPHGGRRYLNLQRDVLNKSDEDLFDVHAMHQHGTFPMFQNIVEGQLADMRSKMPKSRPLFFNETAISASEGLRRQAEHVVKKITLARARGAIGFTWYKMVGESHNWGLLNDELNPRPAYVAYNTTVRLLDNLSYRKDLDLGDGNFGYVFGNNKQQVIVLWSESQNAIRGLWTLSCPGGYTNAERVGITGNSTKMELLADRLLLQLDNEPAFLVLDGAKDVVLDKPVLQLTEKSVAYGYEPIDVPMQLINSFDTTITIGVGEESQKRQITLAPGEQEHLSFSFQPEYKESVRYGDVIDLALPVYIRDSNFYKDLKITAVAGGWIPLATNDNRKADFTIKNRPQIQNRFDFDPKSSHLVWSGAADLSVQAWLRADDNTLYFHVLVRDDKHVSFAPPSKMWKGDSVQVAIEIPENKGRWNIGAALLNDASESYVFEYPADKQKSPVSAVSVVRTDDETDYMLSFNLELLGLKYDDLKHGIGFNFVVNDNDDDVRKGWAELAPGIAEPNSLLQLPRIKFE